MFTLRGICSLTSRVNFFSRPRISFVVRASTPPRENWTLISATDISNNALNESKSFLQYHPASALVLFECSSTTRALVPENRTSRSLMALFIASLSPVGLMCEWTPASNRTRDGILRAQDRVVLYASLNAQKMVYTRWWYCISLRGIGWYFMVCLSNAIAFLSLLTLRVSFICYRVFEACWPYDMYSYQWGRVMGKTFNTALIIGFFGGNKTISPRNRILQWEPYYEGR